MIFPEKLVDKDGLVPPCNVFKMLDQQFALVNVNDPYHIVFRNQFFDGGTNIYSYCSYDEKANQKNLAYRIFETSHVSAEFVRNNFIKPDGKYHAYYFLSDAMEHCNRQITKLEEKQKEDKKEAVKETLKEDIKEIIEKNNNNNNNITGKNKEMKEMSSYGTTIATDTTDITSTTNISVPFHVTKPVLSSVIKKNVSDYNKKVLERNQLMMSELTDFYNQNVLNFIDKGSFETFSATDGTRNFIRVKMRLPQRSKVVKDDNGNFMLFSYNTFKDFAHYLMAEDTTCKAEVKSCTSPNIPRGENVYELIVEIDIT